jgi:hypothetical protein
MLNCYLFNRYKNGDFYWKGDGKRGAFDTNLL